VIVLCPDCYDAHVATGISQYLIGTVSAPARWALRLGGFEGDKGDVYTREKNPERATSTVRWTAPRFSPNPLFAQERARLDSGDRRGLAT